MKVCPESAEKSSDYAHCTSSNGTAVSEGTAFCCRDAAERRARAVAYRSPRPFPPHRQPTARWRPPHRTPHHERRLMIALFESKPRLRWAETDWKRLAM